MWWSHSSDPLRARANLYLQMPLSGIDTSNATNLMIAGVLATSHKDRVG
jgi:hypothetical protein